MCRLDLCACGTSHPEGSSPKNPNIFLLFWSFRLQFEESLPIVPAYDGLRSSPKSLDVGEYCPSMAPLSEVVASEKQVSFAKDEKVSPNTLLGMTLSAIPFLRCAVFLALERLRPVRLEFRSEPSHGAVSTRELTGVLRDFWVPGDISASSRKLSEVRDVSEVLRFPFCQSLACKTPNSSVHAHLIHRR